MSTATKGKRAQRPAKKHPEKKYGPFHGGFGVAIWLNTVETESGLRYFRSITLSPRRFRDPKDGQWKDASSFRPVDLPTLVLVLQAAHDYVRSTPLPGQPIDGDDLEGLQVLEDGEIVNGQTSA